ncbi:MAG: hypothetical protein II972_03485 [Elusimicrobiaceae bacterium]|nr:hypothetical protein [Elusimicrobiaceae bacterium]
MAKQVIEPQIVEQNQVSHNQDSRQNNNTNTRFYPTKGSGCLGLILFAFLSLFVVLPTLILSLFKNKK